MKPKYKIGTFVQFKSGNISEAGIIYAQVIREDSIQYEMKDASYGNIPENDIIAAYRPVVQRKTKAAKKVATPKQNKKTASATHQSAAQ